MQRADIIELPAPMPRRTCPRNLRLLRRHSFAPTVTEKHSPSDEAERVAAQARQDALLAKATNPETLQRLQPLISKSTTSFAAEGPNSNRWNAGMTEAVPISFGALSRLGALEQTDTGLKYLLLVAIDPNMVALEEGTIWPKPKCAK